ncbi:MAG: hypothetical protein M1609_08830 [Firmicutes bacterium]|nr:hypothetical protein [Bacillota bacterium]
MDLLRLKVELLCSGLRMNDNLKPIGYRASKRASLSEGRCLNIYYCGHLIPVNVAVHEDFVKNSPFEYDHEHNQILKHGVPVIEARLIGDPDWLLDVLPDGTIIADIFQLHASNAIATSLVNYCHFKEDGNGCKYCALDSASGVVKKDPAQIAEAVNYLEDKGLNFMELNLNAGTLPGVDRSAELYIEAIKEVRKVSNIPVAAQICPPEDFRYINLLKEAGLTTISFNMEIYDETSRSEVCPGKSQVSVNHYLDALKYATGVFGRNQVSSWLIAGLEPKETTIAGIQAVASTGAIPFVTVFRPLMGTELGSKLPPAVDDVVDIFKVVGDAVRNNRINPGESACGCVNCGCCSALFESIQ